MLKFHNYVENGTASLFHVMKHTVYLNLKIDKIDKNTECNRRFRVKVINQIGKQDICVKFYLYQILGQISMVSEPSS